MGKRRKKIRKRKHSPIRETIEAKRNAKVKPKKTCLLHRGGARNKSEQDQDFQDQVQEQKAGSCGGMSERARSTSLHCARSMRVKQEDAPHGDWGERRSARERGEINRTEVGKWRCGERET